MRHFWSLDDVNLKDVWLTIGSFDGVHKGHQKIIRRLTAGAGAENAPAVALTFFPHPAIVLGKRPHHHYLTTPEERARLLGDLGVDVVITHPFNLEIASLSAHDFIAGLHSHLRMQQLCIGYDFALGREREGNLSTLRQLGNEFGYNVSVVKSVELTGKVVSSSRIRRTLSAGDIQLVTDLLGRPYQLRGRVVAGEGRGRTIGIPTANLDVWAERALPRRGVYVCLVEVGGQTWDAVTNVGIRPTFNEELTTLLLETHLLDFEGDLYGQQLSVHFLSRLRAERRFADVQSLVAQIHQDIQQAREVLKEKGR